MAVTYTPERAYVAQAYPGKNWIKKVRVMDDEEVHEIYVSLKFKAENEAKREAAKHKKDGHGV